MKIIELILGDGIFSGIEAISLVESPAIEEDFIALKSEEVKLAEVSGDKRILMGALLVPNKPIYRKNAEDEYYIYFSKKTIEKASQLYLMNGNQNNTTLEHLHKLKGLTLVESWLVEDEVHDKSRKYGLDVPVGTWMGAVKVNSDEVWDEYVKTGKVKGFSIEGYFADKAERPKEAINDLEMKAEEQLSEIRKIIKKSERVELAIADDLKQAVNILKAQSRIDSDAQKATVKLISELTNTVPNAKERIKTNQRIIQATNSKIETAETRLKKTESAAKQLGLNANSIPLYSEVLKELDIVKKSQTDIEENTSRLQSIIK